MSALDWLYIMRGVERIVIALAGMLSIFCGYHLFIKGVNGKASLYVGAEDKRFNLRLLNAAPGIFFCLFGVVLLVYAINKGVEVRPGTPGGAELSKDENRPEVMYTPEASSPEEKVSEVKELETAKATKATDKAIRGPISQSHPGPVINYDHLPRYRPPSK